MALGVEASPAGPPLFQLAAEGLALACPIVEAEPFHVLADDYRRQAHLKVARERVEVGVGEDNAAVARTRGPAVGVRRRTVQPYAMALAALSAVPFVGVVDGKSAVAV